MKVVDATTNFDPHNELEVFKSSVLRMMSCDAFGIIEFFIVVHLKEDLPLACILNLQDIQPITLVPNIGWKTDNKLPVNLKFRLF